LVFAGFTLAASDLVAVADRGIFSFDFGRGLLSFLFGSGLPGLLPCVSESLSDESDGIFLFCFVTFVFFGESTLTLLLISLSSGFGGIFLRLTESTLTVFRLSSSDSVSDVSEESFEDDSSLLC